MLLSLTDEGIELLLVHGWLEPVVLEFLGPSSLEKNACVARRAPGQRWIPRPGEIGLLLPGWWWGDIVSWSVD